MNVSAILAAQAGATLCGVLALRKLLRAEDRGFVLFIALMLAFGSIGAYLKGY